VAFFRCKGNADQSMFSGLEANEDLINVWLDVSFEKKPIVLELVERAKRCAGLSHRQRQILPELIAHSTSALELLASGWRNRQALWVGCGSRSLYEAQVVASYVTKSAENAERYYQDGLIDIRDIFDSLHAQSSTLGDVPDFQKLVEFLRSEMSQLLTQNRVDSKAKHLGTAAMAKDVGAELDHKQVYQFLSKFSHSSSVAVLTRNGETWLAMILPLLAMIGLKGYLLMLASVAEVCPIEAKT
jgi:hypothetical protein